MYRHFRWLQAIENGSHSKTTFLDGDVEKAMDGFFNTSLQGEAGKPGRGGRAGTVGMNNPAAVKSRDYATFSS